MAVSEVYNAAGLIRIALSLRGRFRESVRSGLLFRRGWQCWLQGLCTWIGLNINCYVMGSSATWCLMTTECLCLVSHGFTYLLPLLCEMQTSWHGGYALTWAGHAIHGMAVGQLLMQSAGLVGWWYRVICILTLSEPWQEMLLVCSVCCRWKILWKNFCTSTDC